MRTVSNQMLLSRKIFQIIFSSMSLLSQRYCIYDVAATILEWGFPSTTHTCVCTVSIQMLILISTIKENIQLTKIRVSQFLERDIFLHVYTLLENPELRFILQASKEVLGFKLQKKIPPLHQLTEEWTSFWNWMFTCTLY